MFMQGIRARDFRKAERALNLCKGSRLAIQPRTKEVEGHCTLSDIPRKKPFQVRLTPSPTQTTLERPLEPRTFVLSRDRSSPTQAVPVLRRAFAKELVVALIFL